MSSACVLIFKTHFFRFMHCSESHYRYFESTLRYVWYVIESFSFCLAKKKSFLQKVSLILASGSDHRKENMSCSNP